MLAPDSVRVPARFVSAPVPLITPPKVWESVRWNASAELFVTLPEIEPAVPLLPTCSTPALISVPNA